MPETTNIIASRYYPTISSIVNEEDIPDILGFLKVGIISLFDKIHYKDLQYNKSPRGDAAFYSLSLVAKKRLDIELPGTGIFLVLNPDVDDSAISAFPITIDYQWKILAYLRDFNLSSFSFAPQEFFEIALKALSISETQAIAQFINTFVEPLDETTTPLAQFILDVNEYANINIPLDIVNLNDVIKEIFSQTSQTYSSIIAFGTYILKTDLDETKEKLRAYFRAILPNDIEEYIKDILIPKFKATLTLSAGIEFPRNMLKPVYDEGGNNPFNELDTGDPLTEIPEIDDQGNPKVMLTFGEALFYADTEQGFGYNLDIAINTVVPAMIGNTGFIIDIHNLKIDLSRNTNIIEADLDNRPPEFMGVYTELTTIYLPKKWFKKETGQTLAITGEKLLIGTGGMSGTIALRATHAVNTAGEVTDYFSEYFDLNYPVTVIVSGVDTEINSYDNLLVHINSLLKPYLLKFKFPLSITTNTGNITFEKEVEYNNYISAIDPNQFMWFQLGKNPDKAWRIGFNRFDLTFHHGQVIESNLKARIEIPKFKNPETAGQKAIVDLEGHWYSEEDFSLTASFIPNGLPLDLFNFVTINFLTLELGKQEDKFYIGTSCEIKFENAIMKKVLGDQKIVIPRLRVYDDGSIEIVGGNAFIPTNISLNLGPIEIAVTGIHFGSHQQNHAGNERKYNYWGFDGAISIDPLGVDVRGEGVKYYYTTDNDEFDDDGHSFLRIQTIEVDLIIPGTASPESAMAIIHGMVSIPEPGESQEYIGEVGLKLPKANISGYAKMRLMPKEPAFLIEAGIEMPTPIPLAATGLAFYGFGGLLGYRYVAEKEAIGLVSGEDTWYDYYMYPKRGVNQEKFSGPPQTDDYNNPFAIGAGAVIGTIHDDGYLFSTRIMLILSLPSVFIIDGRANLLDKRLDMMGTTEPPFYAGIAIGDSSVEFWFGADYQLPKSNGWIIDLQAEVQAGFFKNNPSGWYVNFGTQENPITAEVLSIITAQSYLMISAQGIEAGARVEFNIRKRFGPVKVHFHAYFEMGGYISFERPQIGGHIALGGTIDIDVWKIVGFTIDLHALLVVEVAEPFLIYAEFRIRVCVRIIFKVCKRFKIKLKWQKNNTINRQAIPALPDGSGPGSNTADRTEELVLGVHMLTNETFKLESLQNENSNPNSQSSIFNNLNPIPLDTYIDIKTAKGLIPNSSTLVNEKIGGVTNPAENFVDLIPPERVVRGGHEIRQVKHKYSIEDLNVEFWNGTIWKAYHPYKALTPAALNVEDLKIGYWQKSGKQYDAIRLLATTPFSYIEQGEPGWFIPEQYGITASSLFCEGTRLEPECANMLNQTVGTVYYPPTQFNAHLIDGAYFTLDGEFYTTIITNQDGTQQEVTISEETFVITNDPNPHGYAKSLQFSSRDYLIIILPEPSVETRLKLTTISDGVTIDYLSSYRISATEIGYTLIQSQYKTALELQSEIIYNVEEDENVIEAGKISKIIIKPDNRCGTIQELNNEIVNLNAELYNGVKGVITTNDNKNQKKINELQKQLDTIYNYKKENSKSLECNKNNSLCYIHENLVILFNNCFVPIVTNEQVDEQANQGETTGCFEEFKIRIESLLNNPSFNLPSSISNELINYISIFENINSLIGHHEQLLRFSYLKDSAQTIINLIFNEGDCDCNTIGCNKDSTLCELYENLLNGFHQCMPNNITLDQIQIIRDNKDCIRLITSIKIFLDFDKFNPEYGFFDYQNEVSLLMTEVFNNYGTLFSIPIPTDEVFLENYYILRNNLEELITQLNDIADCNCQNPVNLICTTSLQEVCWLSLESYEFNLIIPGQDAIVTDFELMTASIQNHVQPIWRPNTIFRLHFQLKDEVDNGEGGNNGLFDYYYGFKTAGPIGHFHNADKVIYGNEFDEEDTSHTTVINREDDNGVQSNTGNLTNPDSYALTSLRRYIDYNRSYPNANGNLLKAKPLFYGHQQCKITLFFTKAYVTHMLNSWPSSHDNDLNILSGELNIMIKDPISNELIPYPLPVDHHETIPEPQEASWTDDNAPLIPLNLQLINNFIENITENTGLYNECDLNLGEPIVPLSPLYSVVLTNLKPQKLYTAIINNAFDVNGNGSLDDVEIIKIHDYVFQTSRYEDFRKQVESYQLKEFNEQGEVTQENDAIFTINRDLSTQNINTAYNIIKGLPDSDSDILETQFYHLFDRVVEGVLGFQPIDPPISTEFNILRDSNTNNVIGVLIRNPEPFNNPNIPVEEIHDTLNVMNDDSEYYTLHSKDYSQIIIMNNTKNITASGLSLRFQYKIWDGLNYVVELEEGVPVDEKKNVVIVNIQINS